MKEPPGVPSRRRAAADPLDRLPPPAVAARCRICWFLAALGVLVAASFWTLDLQWRPFFSREAIDGMARFLGEFLPPDVSRPFLARVVAAAWETFAMSVIGTAIAAGVGFAIASIASTSGRRRPVRRGTASLPWRALLNGLRSIPELVWAAMLLVSAGLGPLAGTLALALHTSGVLGRLFLEAIENAPAAPADALRRHGAGEAEVLLYAVAPQVLPQLVSYTLYRWENNIRAAAVLGVVSAGGLGQMLAFHLGLFHMRKTATVIAAMLVLVAAIDALSFALRRRFTR